MPRIHLPAGIHAILFAVTGLLAQSPSVPVPAPFYLIEIQGAGQMPTGAKVTYGTRVGFYSPGGQQFRWLEGESACLGDIGTKPVIDNICAEALKNAKATVDNGLVKAESPKASDERVTNLKKLIDSPEFRKSMIEENRDWLVQVLTAQLNQELMTRIARLQAELAKKDKEIEDLKRKK